MNNLDEFTIFPANQLAQIINNTSTKDIKEIILMSGGAAALEESLQEQLNDLEQKEKTINFYIEHIKNNKEITKALIETIKKHK